VVEELVFDDLRHEAMNSLNGCLRAEISTTQRVKKISLNLQ